MPVKSDEQIVGELEAASEGLLFMSESDYPFEIARAEGSTEISPAMLRHLASASPDADVETQSLEDFFRRAVAEADWHGERERLLAKRYQSLLVLLRENLTEPRVYRVGRTNISVYILGKSFEGNWLGLATRVVET